jgi:hypothetical protein
MDDHLRQRLDEMNEHFRHAIQIACSLNVPMERVRATWSAISGLNDPTLFVNNIKPSQGENLG